MGRRRQNHCIDRLAKVQPDGVRNTTQVAIWPVHSRRIMRYTASNSYKDCINAGDVEWVVQRSRTIRSHRWATWNIGDTVTVSCYVRGTGTWRIAFEDTGQNLRANSSVTATSEWQRVTITSTNATETTTPFVLSVFSMSAGTLYVDGVQIERKPTQLPTRWLSGPGHSWSGIATPALPVARLQN